MCDDSPTSILLTAAPGLDTTADRRSIHVLRYLQRTKAALEAAELQLQQNAQAKSNKTRTPSKAPTSSPAPSAGAASSSPAAASPEPRKPVRVYMDGCFDMMHYGHSNALRQAKACGDVLVVGLINDSEIVKNKGSDPVMNDEERYMALSGECWLVM